MMILFEMGRFFIDEDLILGITGAGELAGGGVESFLFKDLLSTNTGR